MICKATKSPIDDASRAGTLRPECVDREPLHAEDLRLHVEVAIVGSGQRRLALGAPLGVLGVLARLPLAQSDGLARSARCLPARIAACALKS